MYCVDACRLLKWSKFMVSGTFSKILTNSVLFEVHRLWLVACASVELLNCAVLLFAALVTRY